MRTIKFNTIGCDRKFFSAECGSIELEKIAMDYYKSANKEVPRFFDFSEFITKKLDALAKDDDRLAPNYKNSAKDMLADDRFSNVQIEEIDHSAYIETCITSFEIELDVLLADEEIIWVRKTECIISQDDKDKNYTKFLSIRSGDIIDYNNKKVEVEEIYAEVNDCDFGTMIKKVDTKFYYIEKK